jgi:hypothetical protein
MGTAVVLYLSLAALASTPFGVAACRHWLSSEPLPEPYVRHRPHLHPAVVLAELEVRQAYREIGALYDTPTLSGPPAR